MQPRRWSFIFSPRLATTTRSVSRYATLQQNGLALQYEFAHHPCDTLTLATFSRIHLRTRLDLMEDGWLSPSAPNVGLTHTT